MLRVTADINGRGIGQVAIVNESRTIENTYLYSAYDCRDVSEGESVTDGTKLCEVHHDRTDSAAVLISKVMDEIGEFPE